MCGFEDIREGYRKVAFFCVVIRIKADCEAENERCIIGYNQWDKGFGITFGY